jgi:AraC-like DNA-binding protein
MPGTTMRAGSTPQSASVLGAYVDAILRALDARGVSSKRALTAAGVEHKPGNDPLDRMPVAGVRRLLEVAVDLTRDPYFGLFAADFVHVTTFHALGHALIASGSLRDFCERLTRYFRFASQSTRPRFDGTAALLEFVPVTETPPLSDDIIGLFLLRLIDDLSEHRVRALDVTLRQPTPPDGGARHTDAFGCRVAFDASSSSFRFDPTQLDTPFSAGCRELAEHNEKIVVAYLSKLDRNDIENRVRALLLLEIPAGAVTKERLAQKLFMSPRTLQIKLAKCDTTFQDLVNETRQALAYGYMDNSGMSVTEIAYLLGFSDTSNFSRAFRRWTGHSPTEHRERPTHAPVSVT